MYKHLIRPLLFLLSPERIHHLTVRALRFFRYFPFARLIIGAMYKRSKPELSRKLFGLHFKNPVGMAAGFDKNAECYDMLGELGFGFVEVGTVTPKGQSGNPKPRCFRLKKDKALINRMGFNNNGKQSAVKNLQKYRRRGLIVGGNIGKNTVTLNEDAPKDYLAAFRALYDYVDYFAVNVSCPNVAKLTALQSREGTATILEGLKEFRKGQNEYRPILLKISPDLSESQVDDMISVAKEYRVDGIIATNTTTSREGLQASNLETIGNGGLSGAPIWKRSVEMVRTIHTKTEGKMPIIGVGGIMTPEQALEMLDAGASLIQVFTGLIYNGPSFPKKICKAIVKRAEANKQEA
ncbi:MAG: quinone-dependent dihydroorotate dehydrogenase [Rikenellaceae bacterium]